MCPGAHVDEGRRDTPPTRAPATPTGAYFNTVNLQGLVQAAMVGTDKAIVQVIGGQVLSVRMVGLTPHCSGLWPYLCNLMVSSGCARYKPSFIQFPTITMTIAMKHSKQQATLIIISHH